MIVELIKFATIRRRIMNEDESRNRNVALNK